MDGFDNEWYGYDEDNPECELYVIEAELEWLYDQERELNPLVDDGIRGEIYALQKQREALLREAGGGTAP